MNKLDVLTVAQAELAAATRWYAAQSVRAAKRFESEVEAALAAIQRDPEQFARWNDHYRFHLFRKFPYYVAYRVLSDRVVVVAIFHTSRDSVTWHGR
jgi:toxin ParE1/3/4